MHAPYSYRSDPNVPGFADDKPIIVFDGMCAMCSAWARFVVRHDPAARFRLLPAQSALGQAIYRHYRLDPADYESNILIEGGLPYFKSDGTIRMFRGLGWPWSCAVILRAVPRVLLDRLYELVARNRFRLFGRRATCLLTLPTAPDRFLS